MQKFRLHLFVLLILTPAAAMLAQSTKGMITGQVIERSSGQAVAGATVSVRGVVAVVTDDYGMYRLEIASGEHDVLVSAKGFAPLTRNQVGVTGGRNTVLNIKLDITINEHVEVRSEIFAENAEQRVSNTTMSRDDIRASPGSGGDPLRAINSLPAVSAASAEFADLIVRGGNPDENLTYIDSIPVTDFTYFTDRYDGNRGGRAGILPPDTFDRAVFSAGGFGARYGDRMSSALDIALREPNRYRVQGVIFADSGTAGGSLDIPIGKSGAWLVSARRSYIDVAFDVAGLADRGLIGYPRTWDFTNKFIYDLTPRHKLSITALNLFETFDQSDEQASNVDRRTDRFRMRRTSNRFNLGGTISTTYGTKTLVQATLWANGSHNDGTFYIPFSNYLQRSRDLRDSQFGFKQDLTSTFNPEFQVSAGGGVYFDQAKYNTFENAGAFYSPLEEEFLAPARENRSRLGTRVTAYTYAQLNWNVTPRFSVTPGVRVDRYGITGESFASPRFGARYGLTSKVALTFATGVYRQPPSLFVLSLTPDNRALTSQTATHFIGGLDWLAREDLRVRFEVYRKNYDDLAVMHLAATPGYISNGNYYNTGSGTAQGFEISVQKALTGFFAGQASYGYMHSRRRFTQNGPEVHSDLERPHQLTLIGITRFHGFSVAAKYRLASGLPYTDRVPYLLAPGGFYYGQRIANDSDINSLRLPNFNSLDIRAEKRFGFKRWSFSPYVDIFNVTNHDTIVQPNYEFYQSTPQFLRENKRLPIFGLRIEF
jgi:outer membrane receptor protein involved in Fe transport